MCKINRNFGDYKFILEIDLGFEIFFWIFFDMFDWFEINVDCSIVGGLVNCLNWIGGVVEDELGNCWRLVWRGIWSGIWIDLIWIVGIDFWRNDVLGRSLNCNVIGILEEWWRLDSLIEEEIVVLLFCEVENFMRGGGGCSCCENFCWIL